MQQKPIMKFPQDKIHIGIGNVKPRPLNPTYSSTFMNASLCCLSPPNNYTQNLIKQTSYKSHFHRPQKEEIVRYQNMINYHRFSNDALNKKKYNTPSNLSNYGATILNKGNSNSLAH